jgi:sugar lactone lactonase YvrE
MNFAPYELIHVDGTTGVQRVISSGGHLLQQRGIALDEEGNILVAAQNRVVSVDATTGAQNVLSSGGHLGLGQDVAVLDADTLVVAGVGRKLVKVDRRSGSQTLLVALPSPQSPAGLSVDTDGSILVADAIGPGNNAHGAVLRVDPDTGAQAVISQNGLFWHPRGATVDPHTGDILVASGSSSLQKGGVVRVDPTTGAQALVSQNPDLWSNPVRIRFSVDGRLYVLDDGVAYEAVPPTTQGGIVLLDLGSGAQTTLHFGGHFIAPTDFEILSPACADRLDNDGDGLIDVDGADPGCSNIDDNDERGENACDNGGDDDGDGLIDLADPDCTDPYDSTESPPIIGRCGLGPELAAFLPFLYAARRARRRLYKAGAWPRPS